MENNAARRIGLVMRESIFHDGLHTQLSQEGSPFQWAGSVHRLPYGDSGLDSPQAVVVKVGDFPFQQVVNFILLACSRGWVIVMLTCPLPSFQIERLISAGAGGVLSIDATMSELFQYLELVFSNVLIDQRVFASSEEFEEGTFSPARPALSPREKQILELITQGMRVREIAADLNISRKTVEAHKFNLMRKLDIHSTAELVQYYLRQTAQVGGFLTRSVIKRKEER